MKILLKSEVRANMYKSQGFSNKNEFWSAVELKRSTRKVAKRGIPSDEKDLGLRYKSLIPEENFKKVEDIILRAVGTPSFYTTICKAGDAKNSAYNSSYKDGQYSSKCTWSINRHRFIIKAPRNIRIDVSVFEGLHNLHCELIKETQGIRLYKASWIVKKMGYDFNVVNGYIAANDITSYHGQAVREVLEGIKKKTVRKAKKILTPDTEISVRKFREITGACESGCTNFMAKHNIPANIKMTILDACNMLKEKGQIYYAQKLIAAVKTIKS